MALRKYVVVSGLGKREWWAEDADHALEQHIDAFKDDPEDEDKAVFDVYPVEPPVFWDNEKE
jgi:hypothetical protein